MIEDLETPKCKCCNRDMELLFGGHERLRQYECNYCNTSIKFRLVAGKWEKFK